MKRKAFERGRWRQDRWEHSQPGGEETGAAAVGEFPKLPQCLFHFEKILLLNPATPYKERPVLSHSPPLQLDWDCQGQGPTWPNSPLSPASAHCLCGFTSLPLFPSLRLQATRSLLVLLKPCLAGEGDINLAASQESCVRPVMLWPGAAVALVPVLVPGTFLS